MNERQPPSIKQYTFGDLTFRVETPIPLREDARFEAFSSDVAETPDYTLTVRAFRPDQRPENAWPVITERNGREITVYMRTELLSEITVANLFITARVADLLPEHGACLLHASYVLHEGQAILFSAPSGTGKSTQAHFWEQERGSTVVNEDRVMIHKKNGTYMASGAWATGSARLTANITAPIRAIILLGQGSENRGERCRPSQALARLMPQCSYDETDGKSVDRMFSILMDLIAHVPILSYDCINHPSAVEDLEKLI
jgi:hypothetical protein